MNYKLFFILLSLFILQGCKQEKKAQSSKTIEISKAELLDKIKGGMVGQLLGNLNGLPYEFKFVNEPGNVTEYTPSLPEGARTDDDTDIEWMYIYYMQQEDNLFLPYQKMPQYWKKHINFKVWASNQMARQLMEIGFIPPITGNSIINPWAEVNLAGQFTCETFALAAPGMPAFAEKLGLHYTLIVIDGEPAQATQLFTAMIAEAFITDDLQKILDAGINALDKNAETYQAVQDVISWHKENPDNWKITRQNIKKKYHNKDGELPINNDGVNTSAIIAAFLYGEGDFIETMKLAFNMGWDSDCNAATIETVLGVIYGYQWMDKQGWDIKDRYWNTTRPGLPEDETITSFSERIAALAEKAILENGGKKSEKNGHVLYTINYLPAKSMHSPIPNELKYKKTKEKYNSFINNTFEADQVNEQDLMKAAYLTLCFNNAKQYIEKYPEKWEQARALLQEKLDFMHTLHGLPDYIASDIKKRATETGLTEINIEPSMKGNTTFILPGYEDAKAVHLGGTFNNWEAWKNPMTKTSDGWKCKLYLKPGKYTYKFMITKKDNKKEWVLDPANPKNEVNVEGYKNSVLIIK